MTIGDKMSACMPVDFIIPQVPMPPAQSNIGYKQQSAWIHLDVEKSADVRFLGERP